MISDARAQRRRMARGRSAGTGSGGLLDEIGKTFGDRQLGRNLKDGLNSLLDRFRSNGQGEKAELRGSRPTPTGISATATSRAPSATTRSTSSPAKPASRAPNSSTA